jgi:hypothetical protein
VSFTRLRVLGLIALVGGVLAWAGGRVWVSRAATLPRVPLASAALLALVAVAVLLAALSLRGRLAHRPGRRPVPPLGAARFAVLAKASSHAGALLCGGYLGLLVVVVPDLETAAARAQLLSVGLSALAAALLVGAGLLLEHVCRLPPGERGADDQDDGPSAAA